MGLLVSQKRVEEDLKLLLLQKKSFERIPFEPGTFVYYNEWWNANRFPFYAVHSYLVDLSPSTVFDNTPGLTVVLGPIWSDPSNQLDDIDAYSIYELAFDHIKKADKGLLTAYLTHPKEDWRKLAQAVYKHLDSGE